MARNRALAIIAGFLLANCTPPATPVKNLIRDGIGVAGVELGMTPAQVATLLGKPVSQNAADGHVVFMSFHQTDIFGVYFDPSTDRVRMIIVAVKDKTWCTAYDVCLYREGDLAKLKAHHGADLLRFTDRDGSITYRLLKNNIMTEFTPVEARNGIVQAAILNWDGAIDQSSFD